MEHKDLVNRNEIIRVFPRKTRATPDDKFVTFGPPGLFVPEAEEVHISVTFTNDIEKAEMLADAWHKMNPYPVRFGGPALNDPGAEFIPGLYLKTGYTITSRGCPNNCWFCFVPKREGDLKELKIKDGFNVLDNNLLACSEKHIRSVFSMLKRQKEKAQFTGGLDARLLQDWHIDLLSDLKPAQMFFAYDDDSDFIPLSIAANKLKEAGFNRQSMRCYVLIGSPKDTINKAEKRLEKTIELGFFPMAMLYQGKKENKLKEWKQLQRLWARPAIIYSKLKTCMKKA